MIVIHSNVGGGGYYHRRERNVGQIVIVAVQKNVRRIVPGTNENARRIVDNPLKRRHLCCGYILPHSSKRVSKRNNRIGID